MNCVVLAGAPDRAQPKPHVFLFLLELIELDVIDAICIESYTSR